MKVDVSLTWELRDKNGQLKSYSTKKANSLVIALIDCIYYRWAVVNTNVIDVTNTSRVMGDNQYDMRMDGGAGITTKGIVVGTGTNAVAMSNYALQTLIGHGNGAGQLSYGATSFTAPTTSGSTRSFTIQRTFTNNSGADITVNEVGLYSLTGGGPWTFLFDRTLSTRTISNGTTGTCTYTISITV